MRFANPYNLYLLWALIPLVFLLLWFYRRRLYLLRSFASEDLMNEIAANFHAQKLGIKLALIFMIFTLGLLALARPQWGYELREVKRKGLDILIVIDTSRSMLTQDVKPNRLERTKLAVRDLLKKVRGDRVGLIAFSGSAYLVCPLTVDYSGFLMSLEDLDTATIPRGGTNITAAIKEAIKEYDTTSAKYKAVIILTDGENLESDPASAIQEAKKKEIKIYTIGIGTKEGELIQVPNIVGDMEYLKDAQGNFVKSRLNERLLQDIALSTGGLYVRSSGAEFGLGLIYDRELSKLERREIESKMEKDYFERFQLPLGLAFILLLAETCITTRKKS